MLSPSSKNYSLASEHNPHISMSTEVAKYGLAAKQGNMLAQYKIGKYYEDIDKEKEAFHYYKLAADQGHSEAQYRVGGIYENQQNEEKAFHYYKLAADQGHLMALCDLAAYYEEGTGVEEDPEKAYLCYQLAAEKGSSTAQLRIAEYYEKDDPEKAVHYYKLAAENKNTSVQEEAQFQLALHYEEGVGVEKNKKTAIHYCFLSAQKNYPPALCMQATYYLHGDGVVQDEKQAFQYYKLAAQGKEFEAHYWLGYCYEMGRGVKVNFERAIHHYNLAADNGSSAAKYALGICYLEEKGVKKDLIKAFNYFCQSSKDNNQAKHQVILCYALGQGVDPNRKQAINSYREWEVFLKIEPVLLHYLLFNIYVCKPSKPSEKTEDTLLEDYYLISKIYKIQEQLDTSSEEMKKRIEQVNSILSDDLNNILTRKFSQSLFFNMLQESDLSEVSPLILPKNINTIKQNINIFFNQLIEKVTPLPHALYSIIFEYFFSGDASLNKSNTSVSTHGMFGKSAGKKRSSSQIESDKNLTNSSSVKYQKF